MPRTSGDIVTRRQLCALYCTYGNARLRRVVSPHPIPGRVDPICNQVPDVPYSRRRGITVVETGSGIARDEGGEPTMQIEFGAPVIGVDGKRLGEVDGFVVNAGTKRASAILVDAGLFDRGKHLVGISAVTRSDQDGLHLDEPAATSEASSQTLDSEEVSLAQRVEPPAEFIPAGGVGGPVYADDEAASGKYPDNSSFFEIAPLDPPVVEVESNLGANEVVLGRETHAISSDQERLGNVIAFELGDMGLVESVLVSEGLIFKERVTFPLTEIEEFGTNAVHLRVTRSDAEAG